MSTLIPDVLAGIGVLSLVFSGGIILIAWLQIRREDRAAKDRAARRAHYGRRVRR